MLQVWTTMNKIMMQTSLFYALIYMSTGAFFSYISVYYTEIGLGNFEVGILTSVGAVIGLIAQPLWGIISDRSRYKNNVLVCCILLAALSVWLVQWSGISFGLLLLAMVVFSFFQVAINPLSDAITLELSSKGIVKFSGVRTFGSVGYAVMSVLAGWMFARNIHSIFIVTSVVMFVSFVISLLLPKVEGHQNGKKKVKVTELFKHRPLMVLYAYAFILSSTLGFFFSFHAIYSQEQGVSMEIIGLGIAIGSISQFPFMIWFDWIFRRFGMVNILLFSGLIHVIRWLLYATALTPQTVVIMWALHGGTYILFYLCLSHYVNEHVMKELKATGLMFNSIILLGAGKIVGAVLGGWYSSRFGFASAFILCTALSLAATAAFWWVSLRTPLLRTFAKERHAPSESV
ncbi:MFS transporter [Paenibacillus sp. GCM10023248]|uniref:MFS transporter n=1 Tax=unclassified Paenibacillus TaxID=185978 RepID=UPI0023783076|nr:MFS transporter [Paenibacillus sp. MAHUQ-63]MDD9269403.1 MFS transporter [Paenibacillus sp. MAHUQ-63]